MIQLTVNGKPRRFEGDPEMPLLWFLRDELQLTKERFRAVLTPEQRERFDQLMKQQQRPRDSRRPGTRFPEGTSSVPSPSGEPGRPRN